MEEITGNFAFRIGFMKKIILQVEVIKEYTDAHTLIIRKSRPYFRDARMEDLRKSSQLMKNLFGGE